MVLCLYFVELVDIFVFVVLFLLHGCIWFVMFYAAKMDEVGW